MTRSLPPPWEAEIREILRRRQLDACADWKAPGEKISGHEIVGFDLDRYSLEYTQLPPDGKDESFPGRFILAALAQKSMVTNKIFSARDRLAGFSVDYRQKGFQGIRDYMKLIDTARKERRHD